MIDAREIAQWSRLFAVLGNLDTKLSKLDEQMQAVREQQSMMMGKLEEIEGELAWEDDEDEDEDDEEDDSFIDDGSEESEGEESEDEESEESEYAPTSESGSSAAMDQS
jgi:hypothetical protein